MSKDPKVEAKEAEKSEEAYELPAPNDKRNPDIKTALNLPKEADPLEDEYAQNAELAKMLLKQSIKLTNFKERFVAFGRFRRLLLAPENRPVFLKFLIATIFMLVFPIASYFAAYSFFTSQNYGSQADVYAAFVALAAVQIVSLGYVIVVVFEERDLNSKKATQDKKEN
eukprot:TRINITY_DN681_c2_g1_i1.p1 TRINITY_DN681_c2_g1~~TRINITY_DN681_c2_g1_i1.p1  ORF type:complete len:169 (+),score=31.81 TRINITY_DN681_c2_g1_i1:77-583(+)